MHFFSSFAILSLVSSLYPMPKVNPRNKVGVIVHPVSKNVLGNHATKNVYGNVNYAKTFMLEVIKVRSRTLSRLVAEYLV
jgi:hypothetical protein